jgi:hypothetical protein
MLFPKKKKCECKHLIKVLGMCAEQQRVFSEPPAGLGFICNVFRFQVCRFC